jgi:hypothetical protein
MCNAGSLDRDPQAASAAAHKRTSSSRIRRELGNLNLHFPGQGSRHASTHLLQQPSECPAFSSAVLNHGSTRQYTCLARPLVVSLEPPHTWRHVPIVSLSVVPKQYLVRCAELLQLELHLKKGDAAAWSDLLNSNHTLRDSSLAAGPHAWTWHRQVLDTPTPLR